ncbi:DNA/RNA helicase domain-containing protein, partial [Lacticaseibacillus manihotivorans]
QVNKSMTLDIENQLMLYLSGSETNYRLMNLRTNPQGSYYPMNEKNQIFSQIWRKLHHLDPDIFPVERAILDSALFKASPFHTLTASQRTARTTILDRIQVALKNNQRGQLIIIQGEAGSGKTVLLSSLYYQLMTTLDKHGDVQDLVSANQRLNAKLMVNHDQQFTVYQQIMTKLGLYTEEGDQVNKPTHYINVTSDKDEDSLIDVALVDEAHLLYTQGKQAYKGKNQLDDLLERSRVVVAVFDPYQVLATNGYRTQTQFKELADHAEANGNLITLTQQMRMDAGPETLQWIEDFVFNNQIDAIPQADAKNYDLQIFDSPATLQSAIRAKNKDQEHGLSRMLATFDWPFVQKKHPKDQKDNMWHVSIGDWSMPWNLQIKVNDKRQARRNAKLAWAEQPQTIDEVGSTFTIQGLDLNYAGVILGPSVGYENGQVVVHPENSANKNATQKRSMGKKKQSVALELLRNEVNVLLTRGVHGLYIYAVDPALRNALMLAAASPMQSRVAESIKKLHR